MKGSEEKISISVLCSTKLIHVYLLQYSSRYFFIYNLQYLDPSGYFSGPFAVVTY